MYCADVVVVAAAHPLREILQSLIVFIHAFLQSRGFPLHGAAGAMNGGDVQRHPGGKILLFSGERDDQGVQLVGVVDAVGVGARGFVEGEGEPGEIELIILVFICRCVGVVEFGRRRFHLSGETLQDLVGVRGRRRGGGPVMRTEQSAEQFVQRGGGARSRRATAVGGGGGSRRSGFGAAEGLLQFAFFGGVFLAFFGL